MKKTLSIILATIILVMSVFSVNAFAADTPKTDALLDSLENKDEISVTFTAGQSTIFSFLGNNPVNKIAIKDNEIAYEIDNGMIKVRAVADDDGVVAFMPALPYFYVKLDSKVLAITDIWDLICKTANLTQGFIQYVDSYSETVDGKEYYVEEYNDKENVTSKFYYEGNDLKILKVENAKTKSVQYTYFEDISFEADDEFFDTPVFAIDVTPILKGIFIALLGSTLAV